LTLTRRQSYILIAAAIWTLYVWISRIVIMAGQDESTGFKIVHGLLAMVSIGFALAIGKIGLDARRSGSNRNQQLPLPESLNEEPATGMKSKS
jgi:hypothetical protein